MKPISPPARVKRPKNAAQSSQPSSNGWPSTMSYIDAISRRPAVPRSAMCMYTTICHLAGCYVPRVWWSPAAIEALAQGQTVVPRLGSTIDEQRANAIFGWLRDFGDRFGWRRTGTPTELQAEVNHGAVGLIVARRVDDGRSGHIVVVAPETDDERARRDSAGEVTAPLQSQAGATNFRYGTGRIGWWTNPKFAEFAFWLHA